MSLNCRLCPWYFSGKNTGVGYHFILQGSSYPGTKHESPTSTGNFLTTEPPGMTLKTQRWILHRIVSLGAWEFPEMEQVLRIKKCFDFHKRNELDSWNYNLPGSNTVRLQIKLTYSVSHNLGESVFWTMNTSHLVFTLVPSPCTVTIFSWLLALSFVFWL